MMLVKKDFEDIKEYLTKPPVLASPILEKSFLLYIRATNHLYVLYSHRRMMRVPSKPSIISAEPSLGLKVTTIQSKKSILISSSLSRRCDIT